MGLDDDIAILAAAPVFEFLDRDALRLLTFAGERRQLAADEVLFARGERSDGGYVVLSGLIALMPRADGAEPVLAGPSTLIGRHALFLAGERPAEARAREGSEVMRITPQLMARVLREFPEAATRIHGWLSQDLAALSGALADLRGRFLTPV
ncbi:Crp/Fnr family transcriptional regulator [Methylobacterium organophilum]|uniref:Cyclic nucleotide-binding domain-containing protein n=1 Tax=Methylobacterium organophilum TaxID=410 RepID=A0ABQ4T3E8_METOR|nr:Crp/Fnr family transcriptional regulator [Methylobacterium organophilum]UMY18992.1 Crp/Fnr family transcriptional regulator [Methylobacterium organophilum]GJE25475.1 hypothetical protein LKMONMHP_0313 [Methylobacterium organophilum]